MKPCVLYISTSSFFSKKSVGGPTSRSHALHVGGPGSIHHPPRDRKAYPAKREVEQTTSTQKEKVPFCPFSKIWLFYYFWGHTRQCQGLLLGQPHLLWGIVRGKKKNLSSPCSPDLAKFLILTFQWSP